MYIKYLAFYLLVLWFLSAYLVLGIQKYNRFETGDDLAIFSQPVWRLSQGKSPFSTILNNYTFNDHFEPIILLVVPFYLFWSNPKTLLIIQQTVVVLGVLPVFYYSLKLNKNQFISLIISFLYLFFIGIQSAISSDFHFLALAGTFMGMSFYFLETGKWRYYWFSFILCLLTREDVAMYMFGLGLYAVFFKKESRIGLLTMGFSVFYYFSVYNLLLPLLNGVTEQTISFGTKSLGVTILNTFINSPVEAFKNFIYPTEKLRNIWLSLLAFGVVPIFAPLYWMVAPFTLLRNFATDPVKYSLLRHYAVPLTPILAFSLIQVLAKIKINFFKYFVIAIAVAGTFYTNRLALGFGINEPPINRLFTRAFYVLPPRNQDYDQMIASIPNKASVSAQVPLLARLSNRDKLYRFPDKYQQADYVVLTFTESFYPMTFEDMQALKDQLLNDKNYERLYYSYAGVLLKNNNAVSEVILYKK